MHGAVFDESASRAWRDLHRVQGLPGPASVGGDEECGVFVIRVAGDRNEGRPQPWGERK
jgi:hypothetical protein